MIKKTIIVPTLYSSGYITNVLPLHQPEILKELQKKWVRKLFEEQPLDMINNYFGTEIALYFAWLGYMTTALWLPAIFGKFMDTEYNYPYTKIHLCL